MRRVDTATNTRLRERQGRRPLGGWGVVRLVVALVCGAAAVSAQPAVPTESAAFVHPNLIVSVSWLMQHTKDPNLRLVDARPTAEYDKGHIPGAVSLPVADTFDPAQPKNYPDTKEKLEALFASRGMSNTTRIITYDNGKETSQCAAVLDPGIRRCDQRRGVEWGPQAVAGGKGGDLDRAGARWSLGRLWPRSTLPSCRRQPNANWRLAIRRR